MKTEIFTRLMIGDIWLEKDINDEPRICLKDELSQEWVLEQDGGPIEKMLLKEPVNL